MHPNPSPTALLCSTSEQGRDLIERLLTAAGFLTLPAMPVGRVLPAIAAQQVRPHLLAAFADEDGISLAGALHAFFAANSDSIALPILLFDRTDDLMLARRALRCRVADYLRLTLPETALIGRIAQLAQAAATEDLSPIDQSSTPVAESSLQWDASIAAVYSDGAWLQLSPIEWRLFELLLQHRGQAVSNAELIRGPLGRSEENRTTASLLRLHMSRMRAKVEEHGIQSLNIVTVRGHGYMLV